MIFFLWERMHQTSVDKMRDGEQINLSLLACCSGVFAPFFTGLTVAQILGFFPCTKQQLWNLTLDIL